MYPVLRGSVSVYTRAVLAQARLECVYLKVTEPPGRGDFRGKKMKISKCNFKDNGSGSVEDIATSIELYLYLRFSCDLRPIKPVQVTGQECHDQSFS